MSKICIDLGTTNSLAAYWTNDGPKIIPNAFGENLTPSIVSIDDNGELLIGRIAKERLITNPSVTASVFKRFMGTSKEYRLGRHKFTPVELSSFVLRSLKEDAEAFLGEPVEEAIISVPAYFNDAQRKATKQAAQLAGLNVQRLINEPTAAAVSYGLDKSQDETKFLVFDLGGGTFDVSILELFEGIMQVRSIAGDNHLGGEDFTHMLMDWFANTNSIDPHTIDAKTESLLYKQAEICKRKLSSEDSASIAIKIGDRDYESHITPCEFMELCTPLVQRLRVPIERAMRDAGLAPYDIDNVILIGGSTRMPVAKTVVSTMMGKMPYTNINPDEAVALGAAIQLALKEKDEALGELILTDVCPYTLGINVSKNQDGHHESGYFSPIIERNTPIPVSKVESFHTINDNQRVIELKIYQGESRRVENNIMLGQLTMPVPPAPAGEISIDVRFTYDINGILEVESAVNQTGLKKRIVIRNSSCEMSDEEIEKRLKELSALKIHPRERAENRLLLERGESLYQNSLGEERDLIDNFMNAFEAALASQDEIRVKEAAKKFKEFLDRIEGQVDY